MSLTASAGPLSGHPPQTVNYRIDGPAHKLLMQEFPRRVRATFGGETVFDTVRATLMHDNDGDRMSALTSGPRASRRLCRTRRPACRPQAGRA